MNKSLVLGVVLLIGLGCCRTAAATGLAPLISAPSAASFTPPCQNPFDIDDYTPLPSAVTSAPALQAKAAPAATTGAQNQTAGKANGQAAASEPLDEEVVQLAASLLVYDAQTETTSWAVSKFYDGFCIGSGNLASDLPYTCTVAEQYAAVSPSRPDMAALQRALRADIKVYLVCKIQAKTDAAEPDKKKAIADQAAWFTLLVGLDEVMRHSFNSASLGFKGDPGQAKAGDAVTPTNIGTKLSELVQAFHRVPGLRDACLYVSQPDSMACAMYFGSLMHDVDMAVSDKGTCDHNDLMRRHLFPNPIGSVPQACARAALITGTLTTDGLTNTFGTLTLPGATKYMDDDEAATADYLYAAQRAYLSGNFMSTGMVTGLVKAFENYCIFKPDAAHPHTTLCTAPAGYSYGYTITKISPDGEALPDLDRLMRIHAIIQAANGGDYADAVKILSASECSKNGTDLDVGSTENIQYSKPACRFLYIASDVVAATNTGDIQAAVQDMGSTTGGWRYKTVSGGWGMLTLSGILGVDREMETLTAQTAGVNQRSYAWGIYAPIGVEYTHTTGVWGSYWGALFSLLDLGNTVQFSGQETVTGNNNSTGQVSTSNGLKQVWAPGLSLFVSLGQSPFVIGMGYSKTPGFRTAQFANNVNEPLDSRRVMIFVGVDTELFPL